MTTQRPRKLNGLLLLIGGRRQEDLTAQEMRWIHEAERQLGPLHGVESYLNLARLALYLYLPATAAVCLVVGEVRLGAFLSVAAIAFYVTTKRPTDSAST